MWALLLTVDSVHSVLQVPEEHIEQMDNALSDEAYVKGIIKIGGDSGDKDDEKKQLVIWVDISNILDQMIIRQESTKMEKETGKEDKS